MPSLVPIVSADKLAGLPTKALMGRRRRLLECEESVEDSDAEPEELAAFDGIRFKNTPEWRDAMGTVKALLSAREHVPGGDERRLARQERGRRPG